MTDLDKTKDQNDVDWKDEIISSAVHISIAKIKV